MKDVLDLLANPLFWKILVSYWIFSAFIGALPTPEANGYPIYAFFFRFLHILGGNLNRAAVTLKVPGAQEQP